jgi:hypothetical protein
LACSLALLAGVGLARAQKPTNVQKPASVQKSARLEIEGKDVRRVELMGMRPVTLDEPTSATTFPAGSYQGMTITVGEQGSKDRYAASVYKSLNAQAGQVMRIKAGAPLKNEMKVQRAGGRLVLQYLLTGQDGENYSLVSRDRKPSFKVFQGNELVATGDFEYG